MDKRFKFLFLLFLAFGVSVADAQIRVYRWKDKDGRTVVGEKPPEGSFSVEEIDVQEPPAPSKPAATPRGRGSGSSSAWGDMKKEEAALDARMEARRRSEALAEQASERRRLACADAKSRQAYVDSVRGRTVWRTDPATGEQTPIPDNERSAAEADISRTLRENACGEM
ncbi:MAG: DUF4124 domain-containing protein [Candidatus Accumulibacter sp.]|jgi:hypothetical protein|nr:DUF4124 domain-containing protein [Accumulibacter sp.]